jgi:hypothetical protein
MQAVKALNTTGEAFEELRTTVMVDLKPRSLGSCALVGNSQNLLKGHRGDEIDGHDTIFRHNTPVKGFEKVGGLCMTYICAARHDGGLSLGRGVWRVHVRAMRGSACDTRRRWGAGQRV